MLYACNTGALIGDEMTSLSVSLASLACQLSIIYTEYLTFIFSGKGLAVECSCWSRLLKCKFWEVLCWPMKN
jgi:hypothetical protein